MLVSVVYMAIRSIYWALAWHGDYRITVVSGAVVDQHQVRELPILAVGGDGTGRIRVRCSP